MEKSMRNTKKPKGFRPGSKAGQLKQYLSDRCKEAKANGFAWLTYRGRRMKIVPPTQENETQTRPEFGYPQAFIKGKGRIRLVDYWDKDGVHAMDEAGTIFRIQDHVLAFVAEDHSRNEA
jgi:hypothetical protein